MSAVLNGLREARELFSTSPAWARLFRPLIILHHRLRRLLGGMYRQEPFSYEVFTLADPVHRTRFDVARPTSSPRG